MRRELELGWMHRVAPWLRCSALVFAVAWGLGVITMEPITAQPAATETSERLLAEPTSEAAKRVAEEPLIAAMRAELARTMTRLRLPNREPAYYGAYWLIDYERRQVQAHLGELIESDSQRGRRFRVELRVGTPTLDNSNFASYDDGGGFYATTPDLLVAPLDHDPDALRRALWTASDAAYRGAVEQLDQKRTQRSSEVQFEVPPADFSDESLSSTVVASEQRIPPMERLERLALSASRVFTRYEQIDDSAVSIDALHVERTLIDSDGTVSREPSTTLQLVVYCATQADDGMPLSHTLTMRGDIDERELITRTTRLADELIELRKAELAADSFGPVLFEGVAAAQITHELLASAVSGTPVSSEHEGVFSRRLGKRVLPESFSLVDDPTIDSYQGLPLEGNYVLDDEGVLARRVELVERGRLRGMLMSRTPSHEFAESNGHGRSGLSGWARGVVGNLILQSRVGASRDELRRKLLRAVQDEGGEYGIVIQRLSERAYSTSGMAPPPPERMFKLFPDGRQVLVRGASLSEMSVRDLRGILAAGRTPNVFSYVVPWSSGIGSPSSVVAPDLLLEEVELTKAKRSTQRPKVLPRPQVSLPPEVSSSLGVQPEFPRGTGTLVVPQRERGESRALTSNAPSGGSHAERSRATHEL